MKKSLYIWLILSLVVALPQTASDLTNSNFNIVNTAYAAPYGGSGGGGNRTADINEQIHLVFMREEEKLARDVYITLGKRYPDLTVFTNIVRSEQRHTNKVKSLLDRYGIEDPSSSDEVGEFTGEDYGWYFTEKYDELVAWGYMSDIEALKVGAFIEELDMIDIAQCPKVIVETDNGIDDFLSCGKVYADNLDINRVYEYLLEGSKNHLRAYVRNIEIEIGACNYEAQILTQEQVDEILGCESDWGDL